MPSALLFIATSVSHNCSTCSTRSPLSLSLSLHSSFAEQKYVGYWHQDSLNSYSKYSTTGRRNDKPFDQVVSLEIDIVTQLCYKFGLALLLKGTLAYIVMSYTQATNETTVGLEQLNHI